MHKQQRQQRQRRSQRRRQRRSQRRRQRRRQVTPARAPPALLRSRPSAHIEAAQGTRGGQALEDVAQGAVIHLGLGEEAKGGWIVAGRSSRNQTGTKCGVRGPSTLYVGCTCCIPVCCSPRHQACAHLWRAVEDVAGLAHLRRQVLGGLCRQMVDGEPHEGWSGSLCPFQSGCRSASLATAPPFTQPKTHQSCRCPQARRARCPATATWPGWRSRRCGQ